MCVCVGSSEVDEGIAVPPKSPGSWTARQCPVRKLGGAWTALVPVGEQTNRTDQARLQSYRVRLGMDMSTLSRSGKTDQINHKKYLCLNTGNTRQLPHQPTATCSGGPDESHAGERGKSGQFHGSHFLRGIFFKIYGDFFSNLILDGFPT